MTARASHLVLHSTNGSTQSAINQCRQACACAGGFARVGFISAVGDTLPPGLSTGPHKLCAALLSAGYRQDFTQLLSPSRDLQLGWTWVAQMP